MKRKILIIDEHSPYIYFIKRVLNNEGYEVIVGDTTSDYISESEVDLPDLILLDVKINHGEGFEYLKNITQYSGLKIPVIVISGSKNLKEIEKAFNCGAYDYLIKPLNLRDMKNKIAQAFQKNTVTKENINHQELL